MNFIQEIIQMDKKMEKENFILIMGIFIMVHGNVGNLMVKEFMKLIIENILEIGVVVFLCN